MVGISGRNPTGCANTTATTRSGARFSRFQMKGPPMQKPITMLRLIGFIIGLLLDHSLD